MIDIKELKIGNYLRYVDSGDIGFVIGLHYDDESSKDTEITLDVTRTCDNPCRGIVRDRERSFDPILITESELYKIGFKKTHVDLDVYEMDISSFYVSIARFKDATGRYFHMSIYDSNFDTILSTDIQYVHQLQNAIYFATNINVGF